MALSLGRQSLASRQSSNSRTKARMARAVSIIPIDAWRGTAKTRGALLSLCEMQKCLEARGMGNNYGDVVVYPFGFAAKVKNPLLQHNRLWPPKDSTWRHNLWDCDAPELLYSWMVCVGALKTSVPWRTGSGIAYWSEKPCVKVQAETSQMLKHTLAGGQTPKVEAGQLRIQSLTPAISSLWFTWPSVAFPLLCSEFSNDWFFELNLFPRAFAKGSS